MPRARQLPFWLLLGVVLLGPLVAGMALLPPESFSAGWPAALPARASLNEASPTATATAFPTATASPIPTLTPTATATWTPTPQPTAVPTPTLLLPTPDGQSRTARVPILMYHYISEPPPGADAIRSNLSVPPHEFEAQLAYLKEAGYTSISLDDLLLHLTVGHPLPPKPIILTFDDGYLDNYLYAFPLLRQYGFRGTFFVVTGFLNQGRSGYLTWEQAELMQSKGMSIESHGVSHDDLRGLGAATLRAQVWGSKQAIETRLGQPVRFFCYPFGRYDRAAIEAVRSAGYWAAVTTEGGTLHSSEALFTLERVRVHGGTGLERFRVTLDYHLRR